MRDAYRDGGAGRVGSISRGGKGGQRPAATIGPVTPQQRQTENRHKPHTESITEQRIRTYISSSLQCFSVQNSI